MTEPCPSEWALDNAELHGGAAAEAVAPHLASCARCQARRSQRQQLAARFQATFATPGWRSIAARARPRRSRVWRLGLLAPLLAGAAALVLARTGALAPSGSSYRGVKGQLAVEADARRAGRIFRLDGTTPVRGGDQLQLTVRAGGSAARYVLVGSVDGTGRFSPFYPAAVDGQSLPLPARGAPLAPPIVLDDAPGPERILVLISPAPLVVAAVRPLAEAAAANARAIERVGATPVVAAWVTLVKEAGDH